MSTQSDLTQLNADLDAAYAHSGSATDLLGTAAAQLKAGDTAGATQSTTAAEVHMSAVAYAIASSLDDAKALALDIYPPPPPPPTGNAGFGQPVMAPPATAHKTYATSDLVFDDRFAGTSLDLTKWWPRIGAQGSVWDNRGALACPHSGGNTPLGNGQDEGQLGTPSQIVVNDGLTFKIDPRPNVAPYNTAPYNEYLALGAEMTSYNVAGSDCTGSTAKFTLPNTGWYVQMRAKLPDMQHGVMGVDIWFLEPNGGAPEIDLVQPCFGVQTGASGSAINRFPFGIGYLNGVNGGNQSIPDVGVDVTQAFHTYGIEWLPNQSITCYFDGAVVYTLSNAQAGGIVAGNYEIIMEGAVWIPGLGFTTSYDGSSAEGLVAEVQAYRA